MTLVARGFLALAIRINIFENASVNRCMQKMIEAVVKHFAIVGEDSDGENCMNDGSIPISICLRIIISKEWIIHSHHQVGKRSDIFLLPTRISVTQNLRRIAQHM